jgi:hypothetical protein
MKPRRPRVTGLFRGLAKLEPEQDLVVEHDLPGLLEAVALVEPDRTAVALAGARPQNVDFDSSIGRSDTMEAPPVIR